MGTVSGISRVAPHHGLSARQTQDVAAMEPLAGRAVLIVEDDADTLELYATALAKLGADTQRATNADTAIAVMIAWRPDVVLCDLHMPGYDGYSVREFAEGDPLLCNVPMVAISGSHPCVEKERVHRVGFVQYLTKPTKMRDIVEALIAAIKTRRFVA